MRSLPFSEVWKILTEPERMMYSASDWIVLEEDRGVGRKAFLLGEGLELRQLVLVEAFEAGNARQF